MHKKFLNSDQNKKSGTLSKSNPLADALERLERSVAQREGNRMASLVKPIKEDANESNEGLSKKSSVAEDSVKESSNSKNPNEIDSNYRTHGSPPNGRGVPLKRGCATQALRHQPRKFPCPHPCISCYHHSIRPMPLSHLQFRILNIIVPFFCKLKNIAASTPSLTFLCRKCTKSTRLLKNIKS